MMMMKAMRMIEKSDSDVVKSIEDYDSISTQLIDIFFKIVSTHK